MDKILFGRSKQIINGEEYEGVEYPCARFPTDRLYTQGILIPKVSLSLLLRNSTLMSFKDRVFYHTEMGDELAALAIKVYAHFHCYKTDEHITTLFQHGRSENVGFELAHFSLTPHLRDNLFETLFIKTEDALYSPDPLSDVLKKELERWLPPHIKKEKFFEKLEQLKDTMSRDPSPLCSELEELKDTMSRDPSSLCSELEELKDPKKEQSVLYSQIKELNNFLMEEVGSLSNAVVKNELTRLRSELVNPRHTGETRLSMHKTLRILDEIKKTISKDPKYPLPDAVENLKKKILNSNTYKIESALMAVNHNGIINPYCTLYQQCASGSELPYMINYIDGLKEHKLRRVFAILLRDLADPSKKTVEAAYAEYVEIKGAILSMINERFEEKKEAVTKFEKLLKAIVEIVPENIEDFHTIFQMWISLKDHLSQINQMHIFSVNHQFKVSSKDFFSSTLLNKNENYTLLSNFFKSLESQNKVLIFNREASEMASLETDIIKCWFAIKNEARSETKVFMKAPFSDEMCFNPCDDSLDVIYNAPQTDFTYSKELFSEVSQVDVDKEESFEDILNFCEKYIEKHGSTWDISPHFSSLVRVIKKFQTLKKNEIKIEKFQTFKYSKKIKDEHGSLESFWNETYKSLAKNELEDLLIPLEVLNLVDLKLLYPKNDKFIEHKNNERIKKSIDQLSEICWLMRNATISSYSKLKRTSESVEDLVRPVFELNRIRHQDFFNYQKGEIVTPTGERYSPKDYPHETPIFPEDFSQSL